MNSVSTDQESFLIAQFREFYQEVVRLRKLVKAGPWLAPGTAKPGEGTPSLSEARSVWQALLSVLEQQGLTAARRGGEYGAELYREAQYVMAALADEIFVHMDWYGREAWNAHLLESALFQTHNAGDALFQRIDNVLKARDPVYAELGKVYLMALSLGFRGKYGGADDKGVLDQYRRQLFAFVFNRPTGLQDESKRLFAEAYAHTLDAGPGRRLPAARRWFVALVVVLVGLLALSHVIWTRATGDLVKMADEILGTR